MRSLLTPVLSQPFQPGMYQMAIPPASIDPERTTGSLCRDGNSEPRIHLRVPRMLRT